MPSYQDKLQSEPEKKPGWYLVFFLSASVVVVLASNLFGQNAAITAVDVAFVPASGGLLVLSIMIAKRFGIHGDHGKAYLMFVCFAAMWFAAELAWSATELTSSEFPTQVDLLYLGGYPFLFMSSIYYLRPVYKTASKKILGCSFLVTAVFLASIAYETYLQNPNAELLQIIWADIYPIADAAVLFPAVLGLAMFFKGRVSFFWSLACIAIILNIVADSGFFFMYVDKSYYTGHPLDILYLWSYVLFSFGICSHLQLYRPRKIKS